MDVAEYLKAKSRMTKNCDIPCMECPFYLYIETSCKDFERSHPEKAVELVEEWGKEHPEKTYLYIFKEKFPEIKSREENGVPRTRFGLICRNDMFGIEEKCAGVDCTSCWNEIYPDE